MATPQETKWYDETTVELMAPTMLPELHLLKRVKSDTRTPKRKLPVYKSCKLTHTGVAWLQMKVKGPRYWELSVDLSKDTEHLR